MTLFGTHSRDASTDYAHSRDMSHDSNYSNTSGELESISPASAAKPEQGSAQVLYVAFNQSIERVDHYFGFLYMFIFRFGIS
jgi:hypothetical protein